MSNTFDDNLEKWKTYLQTPWGRLQNSTRRFNLKKHLPDRPLHILDAGGGNGDETLSLTTLGHRLTLLDVSPSMLADAERLAAEMGAVAQLSTQVGKVQQIGDLFDPESFDVVLCHNVAQYLAEAEMPALLQSIHQVLKPDGLLSLVSVNRHSGPFLQAVVFKNLAQAEQLLHSKTAHSRVFDHDVRVYTAEEMSDLLIEAGFTVAAHYGVRLLLDYIADNEIKWDDDFYAGIEALEQQLSNQFPYKHLARTFQLMARK